MSDDEIELENERSPTDKRSVGNRVAWLAVVLSAIAATAVGYSVFQNWRAANDSSELDNRTSIENLERRVGSDFEDGREFAARCS